jgi:hypothetical protein
MPPLSLRLLALSLILSSNSPLLRAQTLPALTPGSGVTGATIKLGGYIQARETYHSDTKLNGSVNRARLSADGNVGGGFDYRILVEYESGGNATTAAAVALRDAYIRWSRGSFRATAGQFKTPFSPEYITSITLIETADRATVVDTLAPKRDIGVTGEYAFGSYATLLAGVFNGEGQNRIINVDSTSLVVARLALRPIPQLTLGSDLARYNSDSIRYGIDGDIEYRGLSIKGEYIWQDRAGDIRNDRGWYGLAACRVLPWVQVVVKQEYFDRPVRAVTSKNRATTAGVNFDFAASRVRLITDFVSRRIGDPGTRHGALIIQLQVRY